MIREPQQQQSKAHSSLTERGKELVNDLQTPLHYSRSTAPGLSSPLLSSPVCSAPPVQDTPPSAPAPAPAAAHPKPTTSNQWGGTMPLLTLSCSPGCQRPHCMLLQVAIASSKLLQLLYRTHRQAWICEGGVRTKSPESRASDGVEAMDWRWRMGVVVVAMLVMVSRMGVEGVRPVYDQFDGVGSKGVIGLREVRLGMGSILQALLDSQYSELVLYLDKVDMLEELEREVVRRGAITVFAPKNSFLELQVDAELRRFLMRPGHEDALRSVLRYHVIPGRVEGADFNNRTVGTLSVGDEVGLQSYGLKRYVEMTRVFSPNSIVRKDGIVHGLDGFMVPPGVALAFEEWKRGGKSSLKPHGSPKRSKRTSTPRAASKSRYMLERAPPVIPAALLKAVSVAPPVSAPSSPGPSLGPSIAPAPGPGTAEFNWDDEDETLQFVTALTNYGGYNDMAELLVNATTLGTELGKLARMGYKLTILAPNDQAMQMLTMEQLNSPLEPLLYYHFLSEYQTEESMYNAVKRLGKQSYSTLRHPHKVVASESDGTVKFGDGDEAAHIFDHDIYVDGHISIQGISRVLAPP